MGHSDISTTMDIYAEATDEKKKEILTDLQGKIMVMQELLFLLICCMIVVTKWVVLVTPK